MYVEEQNLSFLQYGYSLVFTDLMDKLLKVEVRRISVIQQ